MEDKKYLKDILLEKDYQLMPGKLNYIQAPCGCGKTTAFFEKLITDFRYKKKIVYLVDTNMLEDAMIQEHNDKVKIYDSSWRETLSFRDFKNTKEKVIIMSYQKFGLLLQAYPSMLKDIDLVVIDEAHQLLIYSNRDKDKLKTEYEYTREYNVLEASKLLNGCSYLAYNLPNFLNEYNTVFLLMTATPSKIINHDPYKDCLYDVLQGERLEGYTYDNEVKFDNIKNVFSNITPSIKDIQGKMLVYSQTINSCKILQDSFRDMGLRAVCLWSLNNRKEPMSREQKRVRDYVIKNKSIPREYDVLIINDAYITGWNLQDKQLEVQTVIVNSTDYDTITQVRGRVRHSIETLMYRDSGVITKITSVPDKFLEVDLFPKDIQELVRDCDLYRHNGKLIKWNGIKKMLIATGKYEIATRRIYINKKKTTVHRIVEI